MCTIREKEPMVSSVLDQHILANTEDKWSGEPKLSYSAQGIIGDSYELKLFIRINAMTDIIS